MTTVGSVVTTVMVAVAVAVATLPMRARKRARRRAVVVGADVDPIVLAVNQAEVVVGRTEEAVVAVATTVVPSATIRKWQP